MAKHSIIRKIYLYLFSLVGLVMVTIGMARLVTLGLKTYVFTKADTFYPYPMMRSQLPPMEEMMKTRETATGTPELVEPTKKEIAQYEENQRASNRQREAAEALGFIVVGLPLFLYHWSVVQRDKKEE